MHKKIDFIFSCWEIFFKQHFCFFLFIHLLSFKIKSLTMKIKVYNIFWFYCSFAFFLIFLCDNSSYYIFFISFIFILWPVISDWLWLVYWLVIMSTLTNSCFVGVLPVTDYSFVWFYLWSCNFFIFHFYFNWIWIYFFVALFEFYYLIGADLLFFCLLFKKQFFVIFRKIDFFEMEVIEINF